MTIQEATFFLLNKLRTIYPKGEADKMTDMIMEHLTGSGKVERMMYKNSALSVKEEVQLNQFTERLVQHEPVQYVLNEAWFYGLKLYVDKHVLIPRPETEELVDWMVKEVGNQKLEVGNTGTMKIIDIGTGSGCIPISIKKKLSEAEIWSCDVSEAALNVAGKNANSHNAVIHFLLLDFLDTEKQETLPSFDIIISNPPYIPHKERYHMKPNVLEYEPAKALFVPDNDPLVFYKAIAEFGKTHLHKNGRIYCEIHEDAGTATADLFNNSGYSTVIKKDMQGKERMIRAVIN
jgi:release factor glutamine methyltransferase